MQALTEESHAQRFFADLSIEAVSESVVELARKDSPNRLSVLVTREFVLVLTRKAGSGRNKAIARE